MSTTQNKPVEHVRESTVEVSIWANQGEKGIFHKATISNSWKDGDEWKKTDAYSEAGLTALATAALNARAKMRKLRFESQKVSEDLSEGE